ncbi:hypothetical protein DYB37_005794 [Aphanomyces astaci]|uniref:FYVE-type domain-containing protein n=1 Tax=Aphanomyces astaci TaxID=112090 RepID=A0A3R7B2H1_APHAT|nr:hypothetical protein DYB35_003269 [Aphanomyces astaci]RHZ25676.1 hypothetical protein DYB37_005794 [Aphanomyces astaci]
MHVRRPAAGANDVANAFRRKLRGIAAQGFPASVHDKLLHAAAIKSHDFLYQDTSVVSSSSSTSKSSQWTYYKEKNGVLLCQGYSSSGDYMVKASVNASSRVGPLAAALDLGGHFSQVLAKIGTPWFHRGDTLGALHANDDPKPSDTAHLHWMTFGTEGAEYHDFVFMSHTKLYDSRRQELDEVPADDSTVEYMTQLWDAVDLFPVPFAPATRVHLNRSGFLIERTHDRDVSRVSFVLCAARNRKRDKWMERMAYTLVHEIAVMCRDASVTVATRVDFGSEPHCSTCLKTFTMFRRRHHCRLCTGAVCNVCSTNVMVGTVERRSVRACLPCSTSSNESTLTRRQLMSNRRPGRSASDQFHTTSSVTQSWSQYSNVQSRDTYRSFEQQTTLSSPQSSSQRLSRSSSRSTHMTMRPLDEDAREVAALPVMSAAAAAMSSAPPHQNQHHNMPKRSFRSSTTTTLSSQELTPPPSHEFSKFYMDCQDLPVKHPTTTSAPQGPQQATNAPHPSKPPRQHEVWDQQTAYVFQDGAQERRPDPWRRMTQPAAAFVEEEFDKFDLGVALSPRNDLIPLPQEFVKRSAYYPSGRSGDDAARPSLISVCSDYEF